MASLLRPVGFWTTRAGDGLPDPRRLTSKSWESGRRELIASYLKTCPVLDPLDKSVQECAICGLATGLRERTDGAWHWPEGLAHYVTGHGVKLPQEFVDKMARNKFRAPSVDVMKLREQLAPTDPGPTSLISKGHVAAELDDLLDYQKPARIPGTRLDDTTGSVPVSQAWTARVQGVVTKPKQIVFDRPIVLGRDRTCDVVLVSKTVSRRHARLVPWRDRVIVQDLGSSNGVWIGQVRKHGQIEIREGQTFSLGEATITLLRDT